MTPSQPAGDARGVAAVSYLSSLLDSKLILDTVELLEGCIQILMTHNQPRQQRDAKLRWNMDGK